MSNIAATILGVPHDDNSSNYNLPALRLRAQGLGFRA